MQAVVQQWYIILSKPTSLLLCFVIPLKAPPLCASYLHRYSFIHLLPNIYIDQMIVLVLEESDSKKILGVSEDASLTDIRKSFLEVFIFSQLLTFSLRNPHNIQNVTQKEGRGRKRNKKKRTKRKEQEE